MGQERVDRLAPRLVVQRGEIGDLRLTKNVDPVGADEPRRITREHEPRARGFRRFHFTLQPHLARE